MDENLSQRAMALLRPVLSKAGYRLEELNSAGVEENSHIPGVSIPQAQAIHLCKYFRHGTDVSFSNSQ
jgi:hypothetical protein